MKENGKHRAAYKLIKVSENQWQLCKVLNEYSSEQEAESDLINLLTNSKSEKDMLKEYLKKDIL